MNSEELQANGEKTKADRLRPIEIGILMVLMLALGVALGWFLKPSTVPYQNAAPLIEALPARSDPTPAASLPASSADSEVSNGIVDLNTADKITLMTLPGIADKRADDIIAYREANGGFTMVEELTNIEGIGEQTLEKLRDRATVGIYSTPDSSQEGSDAP